MKKRWSLDFYMDLKKHNCPGCKQLLQMREATKDVNALACISYREFYCPHCGRTYTKEEMKRYEKERSL